MSPVKILKILITNSNFRMQIIQFLGILSNHLILCQHSSALNEKYHNLYWATFKAILSLLFFIQKKKNSLRIIRNFDNQCNQKIKLIRRHQIIQVFLTTDFTCETQRECSYL